MLGGFIGKPLRVFCAVEKVVDVFLSKNSPMLVRGKKQRGVCSGGHSARPIRQGPARPDQALDPDVNIDVILG